MSEREKIISAIVKSLETAVNVDIAEGYADLVSCGDCPYWRYCKNDYECDEYIFKKLEGGD